MSKTPVDKIKEAAAGETDPKALSQAAATSGPPGASGPNDTPLKGDGKAPYREDFEAVYHRLANLEAAVKLLTERLDVYEPGFRAMQRDSQSDAGLAARVTEIERRLEGNIA